MSLAHGSPAPCGGWCSVRPRWSAWRVRWAPLGAVDRTRGGASCGMNTPWRRVSHTPAEAGCDGQLQPRSIAHTGRVRCPPRSPRTAAGRRRLRGGAPQCPMRSEDRGARAADRRLRARGPAKRSEDQRTSSVTSPRTVRAQRGSVKGPSERSEDQPTTRGPTNNKPRVRGRGVLEFCFGGYSQAATFGWSTPEAPTLAAPPGEPTPETPSSKYSAFQGVNSFHSSGTSSS